MIMGSIIYTPRFTVLRIVTYARSVIPSENNLNSPKTKPFKIEFVLFLFGIGQKRK